RKYYRITREGLKWSGSGDLYRKRADTTAQNDTLHGSKSAVPCTQRKSTSNTNKRPQAAVASHSRDEEELLHRVRALCGAEEMAKNGGMWRDLAKRYRRALFNAIESYELRSDNYHLPVVNTPCAFLMEAFERCLNEIE